MDLDITAARCWSPYWPQGVPHDSERAGEPAAAIRERHNTARAECRRCPLLDVCETYLSDSERAGEEVAGVVAGRYSDVHQYAQRDEWRQKACRFCGDKLKPQRPPLRKKPPQGARQHVGEGLCEDCYSTQCRAVKHPKRKPIPRPNDPYRNAA